MCSLTDSIGRQYHLYLIMTDLVCSWAEIPTRGEMGGGGGDVSPTIWKVGIGGHNMKCPHTFFVCLLACHIEVGDVRGFFFFSLTSYEGLYLRVQFQFITYKVQNII